MHNWNMYNFDVFIANESKTCIDGCIPSNFNRFFMLVQEYAWGLQLNFIGSLLKLTSKSKGLVCVRLASQFGIVHLVYTQNFPKN